MPVAIGWRVDEHEKPFRIGVGGPAIVAVLRTDVNRWFPWQRIARKNILELGRVVAREEDVVPA